MLGKLTRKHESDSSLDLAGRKGGLLVVASKAGGFTGKALEDVVDEGVHDGHSSLGDTSVVVDLLKDLVDVRRVGLNSLLVGLGASLLGGFHALNALLSCSGWCLGHFDTFLSNCVFYLLRIEFF